MNRLTNPITGPAPSLLRKMIPPRTSTFSLSRSVSTQHIPVIRSLADLREWRQNARMAKQEVAVVPTMGALHQGHLDLVRRAMSKHPLTVMTLFVNPMQFAPHEDLSKYPHQLERDLSLLQTVLSPWADSAGNHTNEGEHSAETSRTSSAPRLVVFNPDQDEMYPLRGELQDLGRHHGLRVEMAGVGNVLEGRSRPQFFTGVATICTKLFNAVEPDHAYFGQKDIQQALLLRLLLTDLLLSHPHASNAHIVRTTRDPVTSLALSSRNAYLSAAELSVAPTLIKALQAGKRVWEHSGTMATGEEVVENAQAVIRGEAETLGSMREEVRLRLDYIELFDRDTFAPVRGRLEDGRPLVLAGAMMVGKTRLIDNVLLGWDVE